MKFKLNKYNFNSLLSSVELARRNKVDKFEIELDTNLENLFPLSEMISCVYSVLDYETYFPVWLKNFPFCLIDSGSSDHLLENVDFKGEKMEECRSCSFSGRCPGFPQGYFSRYGTKEICPKRDIPEEIMIEVESKCNFNCHFCFNKISFAKEGRNIKSLSSNFIKKVIDDIVQNEIKIVKFTGGEPLLRKDIFQLLKYAKGKGLETRLNTNCSLVNKEVAKKLNGIVDNILIPIESDNEKEESKITGFQNALKKKIKAIELLKKENVPVVRVGTVMIKKNINNFDKIARLVSSLPLDEWEVYRPIPISKENDLTSKDINFLADKLINLRKEGKLVFIANAIPFCSIKDLNKLNIVSKGALYDEGHRRLVLDPRGFIKPHYFLNENLGKNVSQAWQSDFAQRMRNLDFIPEECGSCPFVFKCCGGSRQAAKISFGDYNKPDPLANFKNVKIRSI